MTQTTARIKKAGKNFEILIDLDKAMAFKKGDGGSDFLEADAIFSDAKKGEKASSFDLHNAFRTTDVNEIAGKIVKDGEVLVTQEHRSAEQEQKLKQVIEFLSKNAIDNSGNPHTPERIKSALEQAHVNVKNVPVEKQISGIIESISSILPIKIETKKVKIIVPAVHTGKVYGLINQYKEKENWLDNGDLQIILNIPSGIIIDFYDKLNSVTHGSAVTEEIKDE